MACYGHSYAREAIAGTCKHCSIIMITLYIYIYYCRIVRTRGRLRKSAPSGRECPAHATPLFTREVATTRDRQFPIRRRPLRFAYVIYGEIDDRRDLRTARVVRSNWALADSADSHVLRAFIVLRGATEATRANSPNPFSNHVRKYATD